MLFKQRVRNGRSTVTVPKCVSPQRDGNVDVEDGVVTLTGVVPTWPAWQATTRSATYTPGVRDVIDQLAVRS